MSRNRKPWGTTGQARATTAKAAVIKHLWPSRAESAKGIPKPKKAKDLC